MQKEEKQQNKINARQAGSPKPCGATFDGAGVNFALYSKQALKVELCLFDSTEREYRFLLTHKTGHIWHGYFPNLTPPLIYGYRVYGEKDSEQRNDFNPNKLLIDPYTKKIVGSVKDHPALYWNELDSAQFAPKCEVIEDEFDWQDDQFPNTSWGKTIIYELHVKGFSQLNFKLPKEICGTYAALSHPEVIHYLTDLGITAVELLPIQAHVDEPRLQQLGLRNYWGYNVLAPFALEQKYGSYQQNLSVESEFKTAVKTLHQAGIEVILDVVFNHTAELDENGPFFSFKGIDRNSYYWHNQNNLENWTGCGNTLKFTEKEVIQWVVDCLCYWRTQYHIDGFRFDLGSILARVPEFNPSAELLLQIQNHPILQDCKLIMEPWDIGINGYQLGQFNAPFAEWNGCYRDVIRQFWLQKNQTLAQFVQFFAGSSDLFAQRDRRPHHSINFLTCHDGFTLHDLVSFKQKHNEANGEHNKDGCNENDSVNFGYEGILDPKLLISKSVDPAEFERIQTARFVARQSLFTTLLFSLGTPMILAGDEFGHTQQGNNNSYCQDNAISWLDWNQFDSDLFSHVKNLIQLRKKTQSLIKDQWFTSSDVQWLNSEGKSLQNFEWHSDWIKALQIRLSDQLLILINGSDATVEFTLPEADLMLISTKDSNLTESFVNTTKKCQCEPNQIQIFYGIQNENAEQKQE